MTPICSLWLHNNVAAKQRQRAVAGALSGPRLRWLRKQLGLTQQALAERLGTHRVTVADWERGAATVPVLVSEVLRCWDRERERADWERDRSPREPVRSRGTRTKRRQ